MRNDKNLFGANNCLIPDNFYTINNFRNDILLNQQIQNNKNSNMNGNNNILNDIYKTNDLNCNNNDIISNINNYRDLNKKNKEELKYEKEIFPSFPPFINDNNRILNKKIINTVNNEHKNINDNIYEIRKDCNINNFQINKRHDLNNCNDFNFNNNNICFNNIQESFNQNFFSRLSQLINFPNYNNNFFNPINYFSIPSKFSTK